MDSSPLNLAHFHERRAEKFLRHHNYDDALKAIDCALLYLQDAYKCVRIPKAVEVLDTQKWELERKVKQIQMRKQQYERGKHKEIVPSKKEALSVLALTRNPENSVTAQSVAKSIDKTIREMGAKFNTTDELTRLSLHKQSKENNDPKLSLNLSAITNDENDENRLKSTNLNKNEQSTSTLDGSIDMSQSSLSTISDCDLPSLAPLELPSFDFDVFTTSEPAITTITGLAEGFQK